MVAEDPFGRHRPVDEDPADGVWDADADGV